MLGGVFRYMESVFLHLVSQMLTFPGSWGLRALHSVGDSTYGHDSNGQASSLWPVNTGEVCHVSDAIIVYAMDFFFPGSNWKPTE